MIGNSDNMSDRINNNEDGGLATVQRVELLISYLLRVGVITSMVIVFVGTVLTFVHHPDYARDAGGLAGIKAGRLDWPRSLGQEITGLEQGRGSAVVVLGLVVLIATPVLRVAVSILVFAYQRDGIFVAMTTLVLALLLISFVLGKAHMVHME